MITAIFLFNDGFAKATVKLSDSTEVTIQVPNEALEGKSMDERYAIISEKAKALIATDVKASELSNQIIAA